MSDMENETSRPEAALVLMGLQATLWAGAGISAFPFVLAGEPFMIGLGFASLLLAAGACMLAIGVVRRRRRGRRWALVLEWLCLGGSLLLLVAPVGANRGPVAMLTNIVLPLTVILLLRGKSMRRYFGTI
jgi:hypothetical protein